MGESLGLSFFFLRVSDGMSQTGIMGYTAVGDPFVIPIGICSFLHVIEACFQVGPVVGPSTVGTAGYEGQYIAAGYRGHGMPRGYAW